MNKPRPSPSEAYSGQCSANVAVNIDTRGTALLAINMLPALSLKFQLVQMVVDDWRHQGGDIQVRCLVEIRNDIREILVGLKPCDFEYPLSIPIDWDTRSFHDSDSIRLTE